MQSKRFLLLTAVLAVNLIFSGHALSEASGSAPILLQGPPRSPADSSSTARRNAPASWALRGGIGMLRTGEDPSDFHFAACCVDTIDFLSTNNLALAMDAEAWVTVGQYQGPPGGDLFTLPVLLGVRSTLFPSSSVRPYGTACGGVCISNHTWTVEETEGFLIWQWETTTQKSEGNCSLAFAVGGGIEIASGNMLFSIDYRYLVAASDGRLGGHLLSLGIGVSH